jgi:hypothetical protein
MDNILYSSTANETIAGASASKAADEQLTFEKKAAELAANATAEDRATFERIIAASGKPEKVTLTPGLAALIWQANKRNRDFSFSKGKWFAGIIERGEFFFTHQGIAFYPNGELFDGQHRVAAVILTGKSVEIMTTPNMDPRALYAIDMSKPRTAGEGLTLEGVSDGIEKGKIARAVMTYEYQHAYGRGAPNFTAGQISDFVRSHDTILGRALEISTQVRDKVSDAPVTQSVASVSIALMLRGGYPLGFVPGFMVAVMMGVAQSESDPVLLANKRLTKAKLSERRKDGLTPTAKQAIILRAAAATMQGMKVSKVDYKPGEPVPSPVCPQHEWPQAQAAE